LSSLNQALIIGLTAAIAVSLWCYFYSKSQEIKPIITALLGGFIWASISTSFWLLKVPSIVTKPAVYPMSGYICSIPKILRSDSTPKIKVSAAPIVQRVSFDFCVDLSEQRTFFKWQLNKVKLTVYRPKTETLSDYKAGKFWNFQLKLKPLHGRLNPGGFDYQKWLVSDGYIATGYVRSGKLQLGQSGFGASYHAMRQRVYDKLLKIVPDSASRGMLLALAMGERGEISSDQWNTVKGAGTSHLLAISGLHIGIAALWSYWIVIWIVRRMVRVTQYYPAQKIAQIASLVGALSIALLSGFDYPAQRAVLMLSVFLFSRWSNRYLSTPRVLALSVIIISTIQPFAILSVSFWLSVFAVSIILLISSHRTNSSEKMKSLVKWLRLNWLLFLALTPITWFIFDRFSIVAYIANLILIPVTSFVITPLVYFGLVLLGLSQTLAGLIFVAADRMIEMSYQIQAYLANINHLLPISALPVSIFLLFAIVLMLVILPSKVPGRSLILPIFLVTYLFYQQKSNDDVLKMVVLDVGQGLAIHLTINERHLVYDTGYGNADYTVAESSIIPYLQRQGISRIDSLVISHNDADHSGGLRVLTEKLDVEQIISGEDLGKLKWFEKAAQKPLSDNSSRLRVGFELKEIKNCHDLPNWQWSGVQFSFLAHLPEDRRSGNNASCVLLVDYDNRRILMTGDIEKRAEKALIEYGLPPVDVVIAPHHGSATSSSEGFVNQLDSDYVVFSTGFANRWKFPREEVVQRYQAIDSQQLITADKGAVSIIIRPKQPLEIFTEREKRPHFWQTNALPDP
jgi:competence protein ComEC